MDTIIINLDDAFEEYECYKRDHSETSVCGFDCTSGQFIKFKEKHLSDSKIIPFINSNEVCRQVIKDYLELPEVVKFGVKYNQLRRNKVVSFLWTFEHIDGCYHFGDYEIFRVIKEIKKWCKNNNLSYTEPEVFRPKNNWEKK